MGESIDNILPPEIVLVIDDYLDIQAHGNLKLACRSMHKLLDGRWLDLLHISYGETPFTFGTNVKCNKCSYGASTTWRFHTCGKRYLFLNLKRPMMTRHFFFNSHAYARLLSHVTYLSIDMDNSQLMCATLPIILPYVKDLKELELQFVRDEGTSLHDKKTLEFIARSSTNEDTLVRSTADIFSLHPWPMKCFEGTFHKMVAYDWDLGDSEHDMLLDRNFSFPPCFRYLQVLNLYIRQEDPVPLGHFSEVLHQLPHLLCLNLANANLFVDSHREWIPRTVRFLEIGDVCVDTIDGETYDADNDALSGEPYFVNNGCSVVELAVRDGPVNTKAYDFSNVRYLSVSGDKDDWEDLLKVIKSNNVELLEVDSVPEQGDPFEILLPVRKSVRSLELSFRPRTAGDGEVVPFHTRLVLFLYKILTSGVTFSNLSWMSITLSNSSPKGDPILGLDPESVEFDTYRKVLTKFMDPNHTFPKLKTVFLATSPEFIEGLLSNRPVKAPSHGIYEPITGRRLGGFKSWYKIERELAQP
ncbi:hypothetical protein TRICI_000307 [Trichomonascus ciferrii]|uniref:F-box domain-containing protein n=1 Tax=Trichomonascus ciferrii TaxID=44093 RepID=A0A642VDR6_9ASCO|nr:hypothetical protein TRICI_000307 [Trichomonascus ciferrii]